MTMKIQSERLSKEYDRLLKEHSELQVGAVRARAWPPWTSQPQPPGCPRLCHPALPLWVDLVLHLVVHRLLTIPPIYVPPQLNSHVQPC
ncbi:B-cell receptor-associated protein 29 [Camelus dromedarius]|uniref:B-cell receptor-associated protein 29 n=1 Tax=Camelus dromedarius TaxID=9838 RepID=A0A5N4DZP3_CAMDR|nr:B-cell receptor-associated protein 29 [Camelus dromedarius]